MNFGTRYNINFSVTILGLTGHAKTSKNIGVFNMNDDQKGLCTGLVLIFFTVGMILGYIITEQVYKREALKAGVGYYDGQTGTFKYKIMDEDSTK